MKEILRRIVAPLVGLRGRFIAWASSRVAALRGQTSSLRLTLSETGQTGSMNTGWLEAMFVGVILIAVLIQFMWQQGIPLIISSTANTTALTAAGATGAQVQWVTFIGGVVVILMLVAVLIMAIRATIGKGSGGNSYRRFRRH